jgi:hypothetical protein
MRYFKDNPFDRQLLLKFCSSSRAFSPDGSEELNIRDRMMRTLEPLLLTEPLSGLEPEAAALELESILVYALGLLLTYREDQWRSTGQSICDRFDLYLVRLSGTYRTLANIDVPHSEQNVSQMDMFG